MYRRRIIRTFHIAVDFLTCSVQRAREGRGEVEHSPPLPLPPCRDEVHSFCPGGGGSGWLEGQSEFTFSLCGRGKGRKGEIT
jgi:hypothetical protein